MKTFLLPFWCAALASGVGITLAPERLELCERHAPLPRYVHSPEPSLSCSKRKPSSSGSLQLFLLLPAQGVNFPWPRYRHNFKVAHTCTLPNRKAAKAVVMTTILPRACKFQKQLIMRSGSQQRSTKRWGAAGAAGFGHWSP